MNAPAFRLSRAPNRKLVFTDAAGGVCADALPVRLFPLTDPAHWVAVVAPDGHELACVADPAALPADQREILLEALAYREFVPVVRVIHAIRRVAQGFVWDVTTDLGRTSFTVENDDSIQLLGGGGIVILDQRGTRFLIPDPVALDTRSRHKLERYY